MRTKDSGKELLITQVHHSELFAIFLDEYPLPRTPYMFFCLAMLESRFHTDPDKYDFSSIRVKVRSKKLSVEAWPLPVDRQDIDC